MFDFFAFLIFIPVQWRITVLWLRAAGRLPGQWKSAALAGVAVLNVLLAAGWALDFVAATGGPPTAGMVPLVLGTCTTTYSFSAIAVLALLTVFRFVRKIGGAEFHPGRRKLINAVGNVALVAPFAALAYGALIERLDFQVHEVDVPVPGLPDDLDGMRLLQLSDIHLSAFLSEKQLARVIDAANGLHPHLIAVTGDLISRRGDPIDACIRQLARLKSDSGIVGCMGNHEHVAGVEDYTQAAAARVGIPFLRSQSRPFRFGSATLNIAGVDYQPLSRRSTYLHGAERMILPGATNLLLSHNPDVFPVAAQQGYNLMLAGHTHGGQVSVEIFDQAINPARFFTHYVYGLYRQGSASAYVTRGIGTIGIPARLGAPPEISLLRLRKV
ncbi:MAG TPA: metallophosphoesterase [Bryobacteraceae bacterium]|nr:metallophosphoesterase [Bryobacteraceae bacterium]